MSDLRKRSSGGVRGVRSREEGGGRQEPRSTPVAFLFAILAIVACCGVPVLIVAAGGLASLSVVAGRYELLFAGAAVLVITVVAIGIASRIRGRGRSPQRKPGGEDDDCCK
ncbi:MAG: hypothetical protein JRN09_08270 [Nitrososphaerota archaeon]|nr:hypothetical protein [Nitrososphaerota archaeon]